MRNTVIATLIAFVTAFTLSTFPTSASADDIASRSIASPPHSTPFTDSNLVTVDLYNLADIHGHIERVSSKDKSGQMVTKEAGLAAVGCYLDSAKKSNPNSTLTLVGNSIGAAPFNSSALYDNPTIAALNVLNPIASVIGKHEFDLGQEVFRARLEGRKAEVSGEQIQFEKIDFPYLAANLDDSKLLHNLNPYLKPYIIKELSGIKVAFIGAITQDAASRITATNEATFSDPILKINTLAKELKTSQKADVVIAVLNNEVRKSYPLMGQYIDGLMGGSTHTSNEFSMVSGSQGNTISATASGPNTTNLSNLQLKIDPANKKVVSSSAINISAAKLAKCNVNESETGQKIASVVSKMQEEAEAIGESIAASGYKDVSFSRAIFTNKDGESAGSGSNVGHESTLADLVADALRTQIKTTERKPVDIGLIKADDLLADLTPNEAGEFNIKQIFNVMPLSNNLGYTSISGAKFKEILEQQWIEDVNNQSSQPMLKLGISGNVRYTYDPTKSHGNRITSITINGTPINMNKEYTIGSTMFLLNGSNSFGILTSSDNIHDVALLDRDALKSYLKSQVIKPETLKRSIGITLPGIIEQPQAEGGYASKEANAIISLHGLSFTEGPGVIDEVTVTAGEISITAPVNNSFIELNTHSSKSSIKTDGAGSVEIPVTISFSETDNEPKPYNTAIQYKNSLFTGSTVAFTKGKNMPILNINAATYCANTNISKIANIPITISSKHGTLAKLNTNLIATTLLSIKCPAAPIGVPKINEVADNPPLPATVNSLAITGASAIKFAGIALLLFSLGTVIVIVSKIWQKRRN